jgi:hypothetical protein
MAISSIFVSFTFCTVNLLLTTLEGYLSVCVYKVSVSKTREKEKNGAQLGERRTSGKSYLSA